MKPLRFPEWFYGGPYLRVDDPDRDLPRRDGAIPIDAQQRARVEFDGIIEGERIVAPFNDANGMTEILSCLVFLGDYPDWQEERRWQYPTVQGLLAETVLRLETKLARNPGKLRTVWFSEGIIRLGSVGQLFATGRYEEATAIVRTVHDNVEQGNRTSRRKTRFVVGPSGTEDLQRKK